MVDVPFDPKTNFVKILLSSTTDGTGKLLTRDTIAVTVANPSGTIGSATITFEDTGTAQGPSVITNLFEEGRNTVNVRLIDSKGAGFSNSQPIYVVVLSAPFMKDLPDIRTLVGEEVQNIYDLDDFNPRYRHAHCGNYMERNRLPRRPARTERRGESALRRRIRTTDRNNIYGFPRRMESSAFPKTFPLKSHRSA